MVFKTALYRIFAVLLLFIVGFVMSSGLAADVSQRLSHKIMTSIHALLSHHITTLEVDAWHYFLLPELGYSRDLILRPPSLQTVAVILANSLFNVLFQPIFLCPFTPQVILNLVCLPFFLYGAVRYFRKTWLILIVFIVLSFRVGIYDSGVEALVRHGMACELLYLLIGSAGFAGWITKNS